MSLIVGVLDRVKAILSCVRNASMWTELPGIDSPRMVIGSSMWHLGTHPDDLRCLVNEPDVML